MFGGMGMNMFPGMNMNTMNNSFNAAQVLQQSKSKISKYRLHEAKKLLSFRFFFLCMRFKTFNR